MERKNELESTRIFSDPSSGLLLTHSKLVVTKQKAVKKMKLVYAKILAREHPNSVKNHMCK